MELRRIPGDPRINPARGGGGRGASQRWKGMQGKPTDSPKIFNVPQALSDPGPPPPQALEVSCSASGASETPSPTAELNQDLIQRETATTAVITAIFATLRKYLRQKEEGEYKEGGE